MHQQLHGLTGAALDAVLTEIKRRVAEQITEVTALDGKASTGLATGSILTAITGLQAIVQKAGTLSSTTMVLLQWLTVLALLAYIVVVVAALVGYRIRSFDTGQDPAEMVAQYHTLEADVIKRDIAGRMVTAFAANSIRINEKLIWTRIVLGGLLVETGLLVVITAIQLWLLRLTKP